MLLLALWLAVHGNSQTSHLSHVQPVRVFEPVRELKCPAGYDLWWPYGKEFNDRYAECVKYSTAERMRLEKLKRQIKVKMVGVE